MNYTQKVGSINELRCIASIIELGYDCSIPYGNASRYDFVADINGKFVRFQCKSSKYTVNERGEVDESSFTFNTTSNNYTKKIYTEDEIDYFITWFNGNCYVIPIKECMGVSKTLRLLPPKNHCKNYNKAEKYLVTSVFKEVSMEPIGGEHNITKHKCERCGKVISRKARYCTECFRTVSRKDWPSRGVLKELVRDNSFVAVSKLYNVSDNTIRKWCKSYNLPYSRSEIDNYSDKEWLDL